MTGPSLSHILAPSHPTSEPAYQPSPPAHAGIGEQAAVRFGEPPGSQDSLHQTRAVSHLETTATPSPDEHLQPPAAASQPSHNRKNLYACHDCGRSYSRPEHLVRHVQTHTLGRRFSCDICQKSFARKDLLRRHVINHENDSPSKRRRLTSSPATAPGAGGVGRVSQACRSCAAARVKCDDAKPCKRCRNRSIACVSSETGSSAAMHLAQHSASGHSNTGSTVSNASPDSSSPDSHTRPGPMPAEAVHYWGASLESDSQSQPLPSGHRESQNASPEVVLHQDNRNPPFVPPNDLVDTSTSAFHDLLRDVLYEQPVTIAKPVEPQGLAVLDFCNNANLDLTDVDLGLLGNWNLDGLAGMMPAGQNIVAGTEQPVDISQMHQNLVTAWTNSPWRWDPNTHDSGYREQGNLPLPSADDTNAQLKASGYRLDRVVKEKLQQPGRDQVFAIVMGICRQNSTLERVSASFPNVDLMDVLVHVFLTSHACQVSGWVHFPTFVLNAQWPEWLAVAAAAGAVLMPVPTLRKFGLALQEAVRILIPERFEKKNAAIQDSGLVQSLVLLQDIALWSGNRRKMEIAECHLQIPVTMMRYRRKFQRSSYDTIVVNASDEGSVLEEKWRKWSEREHWKRLVFHCYLRDSQTSMTTLTNPSMSYSELTLPLPEAKELWFAKTASEWQRRYLEIHAGHHKRGPSIGDLMRDMQLLIHNQARLDVQFSISIFLHGFWTLILEYRQLCAVHRWRSYTHESGSTMQLLLNSRHQELAEELQAFHAVTAELPDMTAQENIILNLLSLNLHVSLDDLQLFGGKEGEPQARRIYPVLQQWVASGESRAAVWHAGQILRYAKCFPTGHLKDFYAVAVHHASLALWTYGVVVRATRPQSSSLQYGYDVVYLDGTDVVAMQKFVGFGQGQPFIRGPTNRDAAAEASVRDPQACMVLAEEVLRANFPQEPEATPTIVENLCHLIKQLAQAAWAVGLS